MPPMYDYACTKCGLLHAELRPIKERDDPNPVACSCGSKEHERAMSPTPGVVKNPAAPKGS